MRAPGQILAGKYRLIRELGRGGMGCVWCAEHLLLHSRIALKLIDSTDCDRPDDAAQFLREARLAAGLSSQHVVQVFDYGLAEDTAFIAMELLEGETLRRRLARKGPLPLAEAQQLLRQVARGVEQAHRAGVVHRDLKPENVFIVNRDDVEVVKVLDFGLARALTNALVDTLSPATPTGAVVGTPHYMSPEQAIGSKSLDYRTDLWSLGVIAFECLAGQAPFQGQTLGALIVALCSLPLPVPSERARVPSGFDAWFARACAREPAERFGSVRELADQFDQLPVAAGEIHSDQIAHGQTLPAITPAPVAGLPAESASDRGSPSRARAPEVMGTQTGKPTVQGLDPTERSRRWMIGPWTWALATLLAIAGTTAWYARRPLAPPAAPPPPASTTVLAATPAPLAARMLTQFPADNPAFAAGIAADGAHYVYTDAGGTWFASLDDRQAPRRIKEVPETSDGIALLPDGQTLAVLRAGGGVTSGAGAEILLLPIGGGESRVLSLGRACDADPFEFWGVQPSPDGRELLVACEDRVLAVECQSGRVRRVTELGPRRRVAAAAWSPDGSRIALVSYSFQGAMAPELLVVRADGQELTRLLSGPGLIYTRAASAGLGWLDSRQLAFARLNDVSEAPGSALLVLELGDGNRAQGPPRVLQRYGREYPIGLSVSGASRRLIATLSRTQGDVLIADLDAGASQLSNIRRLTLDEGDDRPGAWLPDGRVLFMSDRLGNWDVFAQAPGSPDVELIAGGPAWETWPARLGNALAFWRLTPGSSLHALTAQLMRVDPREGEQPVLEQASDDELLRDSAPPPRTTQYHCGGKDLSVCVLGRARAVFLGHPGTEFSRFDPITGKIEPPFYTRAGEVSRWAVSPDGRSLALVGNEIAGLVLVSLSSGEAHEVRLDGGLWQFVEWLSGGREVMLTGIQRQRGRFVIARASLRGETTILHRSKTTWFTRALPSPDGKRLAFGALSYESNLQLLEGW